MPSGFFDLLADGRAVSIVAEACRCGENKVFEFAKHYNHIVMVMLDPVNSRPQRHIDFGFPVFRVRMLAGIGDVGFPRRTSRIELLLNNPIVNSGMGVA